MDNLDYIDRYFKSELNSVQAIEFENKISSDPSFAEEVAFYVSAREAALEISINEKKQHFKEIYQKHHRTHSLPLRNIIYYLSAAAVVTGVIFGINIISGSVTPGQMADKYINEHLQTLPVQMNGRMDSLQKGLALYNDAQYADALGTFERIILADTTDYVAKTNAGLSSFRMKEYDTALFYFKRLETYQNLHVNPSLFYQALTLMERNRPGDTDQAKKLLQQIVQQDLDMKETAEAWLKKW